jgi:pimeloyl-ACP methyl ester carboxylesterase
MHTHEVPRVQARLLLAGLLAVVAIGAGAAVPAAAGPAPAGPAPAGPVPAGSAAAGPGGGGPAPTVPTLAWRDCDPGFQCATAKVPRDHAHPRGPTIDLAVIRWPAKDQANRIGSVFVNPGGPGGSGLEFLRTAPPGALDIFSRFDVVSWDPRGIGESRPAVDCLTDEEENATVGYRFTRPETLDRAALVRGAKRYVEACVSRNAAILPYLSTANTARDLDLLRAAVGDQKLNYIGISHGTVIGATYTSLFPGRTRALLFDAPIDADVWMNRPLEAEMEQNAGFEDALDRFFTACAADRAGCGFGGPGENPEDAFDDLLARLDRAPMAAPDATHPDPVTGDDVRFVALSVVYSKWTWAGFAAALAQANNGNASHLRELADAAAGRRADGTWVPSGLFFTTTAQDRVIDRNIDHYLDAGRFAHGTSAHFWWGTGYGDVRYAVYPVPQKSFFRGPFRHSTAAPPVLAIAGTHDPATPYVWGQRLVAQLGNARLLTFRADGHGSLTQFNPCILQAAIRYLNDLALPAEGASCAQQIPAFPAAAARSGTPPEWRLPRLF